MNEKPQRYRIEVLGCKVNQYDARQIARLLEAYGLQEAASPEEADLVVVHTCGVTATAAGKSRRMLRRMQRLAPGAHVLATGCAAAPELTPLPEAPALRVTAGPGWLENLAHELEFRFPKLQKGLAHSLSTDRFAAEDFGAHTRAFLKVQDGCDIGCSYCIVPSLRKAPRDKPIEAAEAEARQLARRGYREIVITGVSVGLYGRNGGPTLAELVRRVAEAAKDCRIRLSSLHPSELTDELLEVWAAEPRIMPHLHLSLQSGSNAVLRRMRRNYTVEDFLDAVRRARAALDDPSFTTDVIVGFPGETRTDFEATCALCEEVAFSRLHVFPFSPRPGTPAAKMPGRIPSAETARRARILRELGRTLARRRHKSFIGKEVEVLVEEIHGKEASGYSARYLPVCVAGDDLQKGRTVRVKIEAADAECLRGHLVEKDITP